MHRERLAEQDPEEMLEKTARRRIDAALTFRELFFKRSDVLVLEHADGLYERARQVIDVVTATKNNWEKLKDRNVMFIIWMVRRRIGYKDNEFSTYDFQKKSSDQSENKEESMESENPPKASFNRLQAAFCHREDLHQTGRPFDESDVDLVVRHARGEFTKGSPQARKAAELMIREEVLKILAKWVKQGKIT